MLSSISWQHYFAAVMTALLLYYLYIALRYYRAEVLKFLKRNGQTVAFPLNEARPVPNIMGKAMPDKGVSLAGNDEILVMEATPDEYDPASAAQKTAGHPEIVPDPSRELVSEADSLITAFENEGDKQEFISLLKILIGSYKRFRDEIDFPETLAGVLRIAQNKLSFPVSAADLQGVWE
ncbi:hypothetical protein [Mucilaginibacter segetis]|uniref:Uncharacterized protein n=1 Tax=Mucilaginibacter segetis TaxID=2793071 RepID=A0A934PR11_9SPHI|nr:hypothetical protein [Mucilaginibacter segetis]MBK0378539.1 hypothetical protein [Mucilaginibacter segetis]